MNRSKILLGIILLTAGVLSGLSTFKLISGSLFLLVIGGGFLAAYTIYKRELGFLIPGCVITAVAAFAIIQENFKRLDGTWFLLMLGLAFLAVFLVHTLHIKGGNWGEKFWPLFPFAGLSIIGGSILLVQNKVMSFDLNYLNLITPAILVIVGAVILVRGIGRKNQNG